MHPIRAIKDFFKGIKQGWRVFEGQNAVCGNLLCFECDKMRPVYRKEGKILCTVCNTEVPKYQGHIDIETK